MLAIGFRVCIVKGEPRPADTVARVRWLPKDEVGSADFAWEHDREMGRAALEEER